MLYNTRIKISVGCNILSRVQNNVGNIKSGLNLAIIVGTWYVYLPTHIWYMHDSCACALLQTFVSCLKSRPISWIWIRKLNWLTWLYIDCRIRSPSLAHFIKPLATNYCFGLTGELQMQAHSYKTRNKLGGKMWSVLVICPGVFGSWSPQVDMKCLAC